MRLSQRQAKKPSEAAVNFNRVTPKVKTMKKLLATTALVTMISIPVYAQQTSDETPTEPATGNMAPQGEMMQGDGMMVQHQGMNLQASDLIDHVVYMKGVDDSTDLTTTDLTDAPDTWERVGEIGDIVISADGQPKSIVLDAGGFLGMDEKHVETSFDELTFVPDSNDEGEYFIVYTGDRSALEQTEAYDAAVLKERGDISYFSDRAQPMQTVETGATTAPDTPTQSAQVDTGQDVDKDGYLQTADRDALTAEDLDGMTVYGSNGEDLGEISELLIADNGKINNVIIDVGGFLGMGEKPVSLAFDDLKLSRGAEADNTDLRVEVEFTEDELKNMETWNK